MSRRDAERIARLYEGFYSEKPFVGPIPEQKDKYVPLLRFIAGWLVSLAVAILFLWMLR